MRIGVHRVTRIVVSALSGPHGADGAYWADLDIATVSGEVLHMDLFAASADALTPEVRLTEEVDIEQQSDIDIDGPQ